MAAFWLFSVGSKITTDIIQQVERSPDARVTAPLQQPSGIMQQLAEAIGASFFPFRPPCPLLQPSELTAGKTSKPTVVAGAISNRAREGGCPNITGALAPLVPIGVSA